MSFLHCPHCGEPVEVFCRSEREWAVEAPELTLLGRIPLHRAISRGIDAGHPFMQAVPNTPEASAFLHIATQVSRLFRA
jgi:ATP-binding protein involved in chromosome partitioning